MKGIIVLLSLSIILVFSFGVEAKSPGKTGATFLKIGVGAKPQALGGAFCAVADDTSAIYWNPAGLTLLENRELSFTHISWFEDINYEYLSYINPLQELGIKIPGILAGSLAYLGINDIKEYGNTKNTYLGTLKAHNLLLNASYARLIKPDISSGINLKLINQKIKSSSSGIVMDIGLLLYKTPIENLTAGLMLQNIALFNNFKDDLPFNIKLGSCYKLLKDNILTLAMDVDIPSDTNLKLHLGAEYLYPEIEDVEIAIRLGYKTGVDCGKLGFGFGVKFDKYKFDYAYSSYNDLGNIHQLSFDVKFDKIKPQPTTSETKIEDTTYIPSPSTSSDSKSNVDFESEEKKVNKDIEFENKVEEQIETTQLEEIENEKETVIEEEPASKEKLIIQQVVIGKETEEKIFTAITEQEGKIKDLQDELNYLKTEVNKKTEVDKEDNYSKARVSIGGIK
ncbi:MAG: PorV/PorQ family protein [bacterium]